jgi:uncharacterized membrane protein
MNILGFRQVRQADGLVQLFSRLNRDKSHPFLVTGQTQNLG